MSIHEVKLQGHVAVAEGTMAFRLSKPEGFVFKAGQAIRLELIDPPADAGQGSRTLSLVSAPFEQELMVTTRMRDSAFKRALKATMTDMGKSAREWSGETNFVGADMLQRFVGDLAAPTFYIVGPPAMVEAMQWTLDGAGIAKDRIRTEEFYGY
jgi:ferredoxin-NADP reductase